MKRKLLFLLACMLLPTIVWAAPAIFYSDLPSGPKTGGKDNKGVFVHLRGTGFGAAPGNVTIGGGEADNYPVWNNTDIVFQLGSAAATGNIIVTADGNTSNAVPFTVRTGNIYFVDINVAGPGTGTYADPWKASTTAYNAMVAGDTTYYRGGTYTGMLGGDAYQVKGQMYVRKSGTADAPLAWVAYPGETVTFSAPGDVYDDGYPLERNIRAWYCSYTIFSGFVLRSSRGVNFETCDATDSRLVGCDMGNEFLSDYGMVDTICSYAGGISILGNVFHDISVHDRMDHIIYISVAQDNADVGWNEFRNIDVLAGKHVQVHQDGAFLNNQVFSNIRVHDNLFNMTNNIYGDRPFMWGETGPGSYGYFYNNVVLGGMGTSGAGAVVGQATGTVYWLSNTFYNTTGNYAIFSSGGWTSYAPENTYVKNNIFITNESQPYFLLNGENGEYPISGETVISNNYFSGGTGDTYTNPQVGSINFVNPGALDFHIQNTSAAKDNGLDLSATPAQRDFDGVYRPQGAGWDIGAYEGAGSGSTSNNTTQLPVRILSTSPLPPGTSGEPYSHTFSATDGTAPYTWSNTSALPSWGALNATTGTFSNATLTTAGNYTFIIKATDANATNITKSFNLVISQAPQLTLYPLMQDTNVQYLNMSLNLSGTNGVLIVPVRSWNLTDTSVLPITNMTFNGDAFTKIRGTQITGGGGDTNNVELWYLINPDTGVNASLSVKATGTVGTLTYVPVYAVNLNQTLQPENSSIANDTTGYQHNATVGSLTNASLIISATATAGSIIEPLVAGQTEIYNQDSDEFGASYSYATSIGGIQHTYSTQNSRASSIIMASFTPSNASVNISTDTTPPARINNLTATTGAYPGQIFINWTAPGDDGATGTAASYAIAYGLSLIYDNSTFGNALHVANPPTPAVAGTRQSYTMTGLANSTKYYFAIRAYDEVPNVGNVSNSANATSGAGNLTPPPGPGERWFRIH